MSVGLGGDHHQPVTSTESQLSESSLSVLALLGPLSPQEADQVKAEWKKPKNKEEAKIRLSDPVKGVERHGRFLAKRYGGTKNNTFFSLKLFAVFTFKLNFVTSFLLPT